jgi:predicted exporter/lauroyl/myristoyl acyltransferase
MNEPVKGQTKAPLPVLKHPGRWLWLLLLVPVVLGLTRLRLNVEVFDLLPPDLESVQGLKLYQEKFANARELIITVKGKTQDQTEAAAKALAESLRRETQLVESVTWEPPWLEHPEHAAELIAHLWYNQPPNEFAALTNRLAPERLPSLLEEAKSDLATSMSPEEIARVSYDPYGFTRLPASVVQAAPAFGQGQEGFTSGDGTFRIVFVQARSDLRTYRECADWLDRVRDLAGKAVGAESGLSGVTLGFTGRPAFVAEVALGMEREMTISVVGTAAIIALLFWLAHRRINPLLWLLTLLALILGCTLALGGLFFGSISVVSIGFAAILLGLAVDYAVVHYQEALAHPELTIPEIRRAIAPSIFWAAITTIAAFLVLNFGGLPGLAQLGTLVALGVALAALIMIFEFLPPLFPGRNRAKQASGVAVPLPAPPTTVQSPSPSRLGRPLAFAATALLLAGTLAVVAFGLPRIDPTASALRPRGSAAYAALDEVQAQLSRQGEPIWVVVRGVTVAEVGKRLQEVQAVLESAASNQWIAGFTLPNSLWPNPEFQAANAAAARQLIRQREILRSTAQAQGFEPRALALAESILNTWQAAVSTPGVFWPTNPMSDWILKKTTARNSTGYYALGLVQAEHSRATAASLQALERALPREEVWLSGWELLAQAILERVKANLWKVVAPMVVLVLVSLFLAFRNGLEIALSLGVLALSGLVLLAVMRLGGWSWNLMNLMAIPLVLGTGVDYSLFTLLALRRHHGDLKVAYRSVGRALLLCGGTAIAGFGMLSWSSNAGMASLGQVCAVGIASNMVIAVFLLPYWWAKFRSTSGEAAVAGSAPAPGRPELAAPSSLYRSEFWRMGLWVVRLVPATLCEAMGRLLVALYWRLAQHRREVVVENLLPALNGDRAAAETEAKTLFRQFALKLIDLWRYEAGLRIDRLFGETTGWEHFNEARAQNRGVLLLTPHLGNWEFGGPLLTSQGVRLQVLTLAEPGKKFTELRQASRARWNIETLVIREDPLAFLEVIRRLEGGATVALLVDRPPAPTAVTVQLFGQPFPASIAAAELARASGCVLLPVYIPRHQGKYQAHVLPPIPYHRPSLRDRAARQRLTQEIISRFEPLIRQHLDQWYHFVPVWRQEERPKRASPDPT